MISAIRCFASPLSAAACFCACAALFAAAAMADAGVAGIRPEYSERVLSEPPNAAAIRTRMWVPEIDLGFVPQGLTVAGDAVLLAAYNGVGGSPKCRLYRIDRRTLAVSGRFDMPPTCSHAGGMAYAGGKRLFVADTANLFEIDIERAFDSARAGDALVRRLSLRFPLRGSFLAYRDGALWIGEYKKPKPGRILRVSLAAIDAKPAQSVLTEDEANANLEIAPKSQGASFDKEGFLWLSQSNSQAGVVQKVDPKTGKVLASHAMVAGTEDLGFDLDGALWAVSEAGSKRWSNWPAYFPVLFSIDVDALR
jgi:hypothetical protein